MCCNDGPRLYWISLFLISCHPKLQLPHFATLSCACEIYICGILLIKFFLATKPYGKRINSTSPFTPELLNNICRTIALKFLSDHFLLFAPFFRNRVVHPPSLDSLMNKQRSAQYQSSNLLKVEENVNGSEPPGTRHNTFLTIFPKLHTARFFVTVYSIPPPFPLLSGELPTKMIQHPHTAAFNATSTIHSSLATPNALKSPDLGPSLETRSTCQGKNTGRLSHVAAAEFGSSAYRNVSNFSSFLRGHVEGLSSKVSEVMKQRTTTGPNL